MTIILIIIFRVLTLITLEYNNKYKGLNYIQNKIINLPLVWSCGSLAEPTVWFLANSWQLKV